MLNGITCPSAQSKLGALLEGLDLPCLVVLPAIIT